ncbi:MAG: tRNA preQ1(34) S-adenosylmethionine ribosyltransferase-isomerase QueA [Microcoleaceae cyanobacterium]
MFRDTETVQTSDWDLSAYTYELPEERIAQTPVVPRDRSRLLIVDSPRSHRHGLFQDLSDLLQPNDLLVLNNTQVIAARLYGRKTSGAAVEILLLEESQPNCWLALVKPGKRFKLGATLEFDPNDPTSGQLLRATVLKTDPQTGGRWLQFETPAKQSLLEVLPNYGHIPFPPYVTQSTAQPEQYQTIYAEQPGAVAAPTAGLHFTDELFQRLEHKGVDKAFITLHVGVGTFRPVEVEQITTHQMHAEWIEVPPQTVEKIQQTREKGGRVIAVGTTAVRALEGAAMALNYPDQTSTLKPYCGKTDMFIYPGYQWRVVDGLITNFHLPRSSLLMLVSALIGRQRLLDLYQDALNQSAEGFERPYRFYSFGDAMLILPEAVTGDRSVK